MRPDHCPSPTAAHKMPAARRGGYARSECTHGVPTGTVPATSRTSRLEPARSWHTGSRRAQDRRGPEMPASIYSEPVNRSVVIAEPEPGKRTPGTQARRKGPAHKQEPRHAGCRCPLNRCVGPEVYAVPVATQHKAEVCQQHGRHCPCGPRGAAFSDRRHQVSRRTTPPTAYHRRGQ